MIDVYGPDYCSQEVVRIGGIPSVKLPCLNCLHHSTEPAFNGFYTDDPDHHHQPPIFDNILLGLSNTRKKILLSDTGV
jgi:hypothetical protein